VCDRRARAEASQPTRPQVEDTLASVGFDGALRGSPVASLSGGWKMKLALGARARARGAPAGDPPACKLALTWMEAQGAPVPLRVTHFCSGIMHSRRCVMLSPAALAIAAGRQQYCACPGVVRARLRRISRVTLQALRRLRGCGAAARAMLMKADILLLDEPTNHLDVTNVAWLEHYLTNIPEVSSMIVSHDSGAPRLATARGPHALDAWIARAHDGGAAGGGLLLCRCCALCAGR